MLRKIRRRSLTKKMQPRLSVFDDEDEMATLSSLVRSYQALEPTEVAQSELPAQIALGRSQSRAVLGEVLTRALQDSRPRAGD